jgi:hypothetical protein
MSLSFRHHTTSRQLITIPIDGIILDGELDIPNSARALVIIINDGHSSRQNVRNYYLAERLQRESFATLLVDLLAPGENVRMRLDTMLLSERLAAVVDWVRHSARIDDLPIGYFASDIGAAAALLTADKDAGEVAALVLCNGRTELAYNVLTYVHVPTLLITAANNYSIRERNEESYLKLAGPKHIAVIPKTVHLFEERGALEYVVELAEGWFNRYLKQPRRR